MIELPRGTVILEDVNLRDSGVERLVGLLSAGTFTGYLALNGSLSYGCVLFDDGEPVFAAFNDGIESFDGASAAALIADAVDELTQRAVQLKNPLLDYARIMLATPLHSGGLHPDSEELASFYRACRRRRHSALMRLYNDTTEFYIHIRRGETVDRPQPDDPVFTELRRTKDFRVDIYRYSPDDLASQRLSPVHFNPHWFRELISEQLTKEYGYRADALLDELRSTSVLFADRDKWLGRVEEFLRNFICNRAAARTFVNGLRRRLDELT